MVGVGSQVFPLLVMLALFGHWQLYFWVEAAIRHKWLQPPLLTAHGLVTVEQNYYSKNFQTSLQFYCPSCLIIKEHSKKVTFNRNV